MLTSFHESSPADCLLTSLPFVSFVYRRYGEIVSQRPLHDPSQYVGAQSSSSLTREALLFSETSPLWNDTFHADQMFFVRQAVGKALGIAMDDYDCDLGSSVLVDLVLDTLALALRLSFTDIQMQSLLLLVVETHSDVIDIPPSDQCAGDSLANDEDELEGNVARRLTKRLTQLTSCVPTPCIEKKVIREMAQEERIDPAALAAWESKKDPKANKKQQALYEEALKALPRIIVEVPTDKEIEVETEVDIGPLFSLTDVAQICNHLSDTLLTHWRLFRCCARAARPQHVKKLVAVVRDAPVFSIPPLSAALPEKEYRELCERESLWMQLVAAVDEAYDDCYAKPMHYLETVVKQVILDQMRQAQIEEKADREAALPYDEFTKAVDVISRRIAKRVSHNHVSKEVSKGAAAVSAITATTPPPVPRKPSALKSQTPPAVHPSFGRSGSLIGTPQSMIAAQQGGPESAAAADNYVVPDEFHIDEVEKRLDSLQEHLTKALAAVVPAKGKR